MPAFTKIPNVLLRMIEFELSNEIHIASTISEEDKGSG
jgi:hypothetical protein